MACRVIKNFIGRNIQLPILLRPRESGDKPTMVSGWVQDGFRMGKMGAMKSWARMEGK